MRKEILSFVVFAASFGFANAQSLSLVKEWTIADHAKAPVALVEGLTKCGSTDCDNLGQAEGCEDLTGLCAQGAGSFLYYYALFNGNSGDRTVGIIEAKAGQRIVVSASNENASKFSGGKAVYADANTTLFNYDKVLTEANDIATYEFDVVADGPAAIKLTRQGYITSIKLYDVTPLKDDEKATYAVKFVDENGTEIAASLEKEGAIGKNPTFFTADYTVSVYSEDKTKKYNYASNDFADVTLDASGSVATVKFNTVSKLNYTFNYIDFETEEIIKTVKSSCFADETKVSYDGFPVSAEGKRYCASTNVDIEGIPGGETGNYSVIVPEDGAEYNMLVADAATMYGNDEDEEPIDFYYFIEAEDYAYAPGAYNSIGASNGRAAQVKGGITDAKQLIYVALTPGKYVVVSSILANEGRNLALRTASMTPEEYLNVEEGSSANPATAKGDVMWSFEVTEQMCDSLLNNEAVCYITIGGKNQSAEKYNQSADIDFVAIFKQGYEQVKVDVPEDPEGEAAIMTIEAVKDDAPIYNINGMRVNKNGLKRNALYIQNNEKFILK